MLTGVTVFDCATQFIRNYGPQSRGTAGTLIFWLQVPDLTLY